MPSGCRTPGAVYDLSLSDTELIVRVAFGRNLALGTDEARDLEDGAHAALEGVLAPFFGKPDDGQRYALVEQMGHRATVAAVRETTFCGKAMLEVTDLKAGSVHLVAPESLYEVTWLTEDEARRRARPWTAVALPAADPWGVSESDEDDDESARELAEEGNAVAMSAAERDEYDRDGEAWLDAQDEADADEDGDQ